MRQIKNVKEGLRRMNTQDKIDRLAKAKGVVNSSWKKSNEKEDSLVREVVEMMQQAVGKEIAGGKLVQLTDLVKDVLNGGSCTAGNSES